MISISFTSVLLIATVAHLMMAAVMALFARHRVQYLSLTVVMGLFGIACLVLWLCTDVIVGITPAKLEPGLLFGLTATVFLQSIYPLSIPMPAYLQWKRMLRYAAPVVILFLLYGVMVLLGVHPVKIREWSELSDYLFTSDVLLRFAFLILSIYYIVNMFRLPRTLLLHPDIPRYLIGYCIGLGLSSCIFVWMTIDFSPHLFLLWLVILTLQNLYMCFRTLETLALTLPKPEIKAVEEEPVVEETGEEQDEDFNEANLHRFERIEFWMQHNRDAWKDYTFGRDQLCEAVGLNRHLLLQSVRSQGYYNIHEYISTYRVAELQRMIARGEIRTLSGCQDAGFGTVKTARSSFEKITGTSLDEYWAKYR